METRACAGLPISELNRNLEFVPMEMDSSSNHSQNYLIAFGVFGVGVVLLLVCWFLWRDHTITIKPINTTPTTPTNTDLPLQHGTLEAWPPIFLSVEDQKMPMEPIFITNYGFREERSRGSRLITLECVTNFVAHARQCGLGICASGPLEVRVRSGANNVAYGKTTNSFFDLMYSDTLHPSVVSMDSRGARDATGLPVDVNEFSEDPSSLHLAALAAWANTNVYAYTPPTEKTDAAVGEFLGMEIPGFADRYCLESCSQVELGGYKTPFVKYTYAATNCFKDFSNMNRDEVDVTLRVGGPNVSGTSNETGTETVLVNYGDPGVVWRMIKAQGLKNRKSP